MNDMRASRTRKILEADAVAKAEGISGAFVLARVLQSSGVCVAGMLENVRSRNLGGPAISPVWGKSIQNSAQGWAEGWQEVGLSHSTEEVR